MPHLSAIAGVITRYAWLRRGEAGVEVDSVLEHLEGWLSLVVDHDGLAVENE